ncbi:hypothetical protein [Pedobacter frigoris]|uniref:hypothetical protein n=1 Tax=Pedobacter frigoris TaxID=2571272 RepID=UPI0029307B46|nr:hypothetical protein [Pedobacter frigoris]
MVKSIVKFSAIIMLFVSACSSSNNKPLLIKFSADSTAIEFNNVDPAGMLELNNLSKRDSVLNDLISVLQIPSETDTLKEAAIQGVMIITDSNVVFKPVRPFLKGRDYLVITHLNSSFGEMDKILKSELNYGVKPNQKVLTR